MPRRGNLKLKALVLIQTCSTHALSFEANQRMQKQLRTSCFFSGELAWISKMVLEFGRQISPFGILRTSASKVP